MATTTEGGREFDFAVFFERYRRPITAGAVAVVVLGAGGWFWNASRTLKETRGAQAFSAAERSYYSGNLQLAEADLARVVQRYGGTRAGVRATMLLARAMYQQGKADSGVARLREVVSQRAAKPFKAALYAMIAGGLEESAKYDSAAIEYGRAAAESITQIDRELYLADQARALTSAGKTAEALTVWQTIAERDASPLISEARLRIGELSATPAKGS